MNLRIFMIITTLLFLEEYKMNIDEVYSIISLIGLWVVSFLAVVIASNHGQDK